MLRNVAQRTPSTCCTRPTATTLPTCEQYKSGARGVAAASGVGKYMYLAVGGGDRQAELGRGEHGHGGAELDREAASGRDLGEARADRVDDAVAEHPQAHAHAHAAEQQQPHGRGRALLHHALAVRQPDSHQRRDRIAAA